MGLIQVSEHTNPLLLPQRWLSVAERDQLTLAEREPAARIIREVLTECADTGIGNYTFEEIKSQRKNQKIYAVRMRCIAAVVARCRHMTHAEIGILFNRDRSSIVNAARRSGLNEEREFVA